MIIDGEKNINFQFYDEEHEEYIVKPMKIGDFLEKYSEETVPTIEETAQPDVPDKNVGDTISRQAAIDALMNSELGSWNNDDYERGARAQHLDDVAAIKNVPSVKRKRKPSVQPDYDLSGYSDRLWKAAYERGKAEAEPRWIPVEERLPRQCEMVLITIIRKNERYNNIPFISIGYIGWSNTTWWCAHDGDCKSANVEVLAWMPLPKRYERSEDAES